MQEIPNEMGQTESDPMPHQIAETVNHLIEVCRDGQNGFEAAAKATKDTSLQAELMQYSLQRQRFAADLEAAMYSLGEPFRDSGTVGAALHRGWMNIKAMISDDRLAVLEECERGEDSAVTAYRDAMSSTIGSTMGTLIESQYEQIQRVHDRVKELRDAAHAK